MSKLKEESWRRSIQHCLFSQGLETHTVDSRTVSSEARGINFDVIQLPVKHTNSRSTHRHTTDCEATPASHTRHLLLQIALKVPSDEKDVWMSTTGRTRTWRPHSLTCFPLHNGPHLWPTTFVSFHKTAFWFLFIATFWLNLYNVYIPLSLSFLYLASRLECMFYLYITTAMYSCPFLFLVSFLWDA